MTGRTWPDVAHEFLSLVKIVAAGAIAVVAVAIHVAVLAACAVVGVAVLAALFAWEAAGDVCRRVADRRRRRAE